MSQNSLDIGAEGMVAPCLELPYDPSENRPLRLAMSIGGENRLGYVERSHVTRFADAAGIERERCLNLMASLCYRIPARTREVLGEASRQKLPGADELAERLAPRVEAHCARTLQML